MTKKEQMVLMRESGMKLREIADALGVSRQYVAEVCGKCTPAHFRPVGSECIYPNLRKWMNENNVSRKEFVKRMGLEIYPDSYNRFGKLIKGESQPPKPYIDKMLKVTGLSYETLFAEVAEI